MSSWVFEWMNGNVSGYMPFHVKRYIHNRAKIPYGHFSMLNEIYLNLLALLEDKGFKMPDKMIPDISTGKMFSSFLRTKGVQTDDFPTYQHEFLDNTCPVVNARLYPIEYLPEFRKFFNAEWLPNRATAYFQKKAPKALPYIHKIKQLPSS